MFIGGPGGPKGFLGGFRWVSGVDFESSKAFRGVSMCFWEVSRWFQGH
jgi:hypothetical protein